jgi:hypothetical protein
MGMIIRKRGGVPIEGHRLFCLQCEYDHMSTRIINRYKNNGTDTMHFLCENCKYPLRMTTTRRGFYVFSNQGAYSYRPRTWDDVIAEIPVKMTDELAAWFKDKYHPPRKKIIKNL